MSSTLHLSSFRHPTTMATRGPEVSASARKARQGAKFASRSTNDPEARARPGSEVNRAP